MPGIFGDPPEVSKYYSKPFQNADGCVNHLGQRRPFRLVCTGMAALHHPKPLLWNRP